MFKNYNLGKRLYTFIGKRVTTKNIKRAIFVAALLAYTKNLEDPDVEILNRLNNLFDLARDPKAVLLPMMTKNIIWDTLDKEEAVFCINNKVVTFKNCDYDSYSESERSLISEHILSNTPEWLIYGPKDTMMSDIVKLLQHLSDFDCKTTHA
jgi:hypothetical protein